MKEITMFNFRIINMPDGNQIIDPTLKTPENALTPLQFIEYTEMDNQIAYMERMKQKEKTEAERKRKVERNPIFKIACLCRLCKLV